MAYISSQMPGQDIMSVLGLRQQMSGQPQRRGPLDQLEAEPGTRPDIPGMQNAGTVRPGVQVSPGANAPLADIPPMPAAEAGASGSFPVVQNPQPQPGTGSPPRGVNNSPLDIGALSAAAGPGATGIIGASDRYTPLDPSQPMSPSELHRLPSSQLGNLTMGNQIQLANMMAAGGYNGYTGGVNPTSPEDRSRAFAGMLGQQGANVNQQAEDRQRTALLGSNGLPGSMGINARAQQLAEDSHSFNSSQSVANQNSYRRWLEQRMANGAAAPTAEESATFRSRLPQVAGAPGTVSSGAPPAGAGAPGSGPLAPPGAPAPNPSPLGPGFDVPPASGTEAVTHPWASMQNQLDSTWRQALTNAGVAPGQGGVLGSPTPDQQPVALTNFIHALSQNGVTMGPQNVGAIRQYLSSRTNPEAAERWWQTRDSVLPDLGMGTESQGAAARRMMRQAAGQGASSGNLHSPLGWLSRFFDTSRNRQYQ